jgi:integrin alpha FG-GAP repeat containing protein 1
VKYPLQSLFPNAPSLLVQDTTFSPPLPVSLKLGDANLDGFPDMLLITVSGSHRVPNLLYSVPCGPGVAGCVEHTGGRGWHVADKGVQALSSVSDARSVTFLDMDEDVSALRICLLMCSLTVDSGHIGYIGTAFWP